MFSFTGDMVLDPFAGTGTTTLAAMRCDRNSIANEIDPAYAAPRSGSRRRSKRPGCSASHRSSLCAVPLGVRPRNPPNERLVVVRIPGLGCGGGCMQSALPRVVTVDHNRSEGIKANVICPIADPKASEVLHHSGRHCRLTVRSDDQGTLARGLAQGACELVCQIDDDDPTGDRTSVSIVNDLMRRRELIEDPRLRLAVLCHALLRLTGDSHTSKLTRSHRPRVTQDRRCVARRTNCQIDRLPLATLEPEPEVDPAHDLAASSMLCRMGQASRRSARTRAQIFLECSSDRG